jgi:hypothetical protein
VRGRHHLRFLPVSSVRQTVHRSSRLDNAGELLAVGNGSTAAFSLSSGGPRSPYSPLSNPRRSSRIGRPGHADTPSRV